MRKLRSLKLLFNCQPAAVNVETSTLCNRACSYCPNAYWPRPDVKMLKVHIEEILHSLAWHDYKGTIRFWGIDEWRMGRAHCLLGTNREIPDQVKGFRKEVIP